MMKQGAELGRAMCLSANEYAYRSLQVIASECELAQLHCIDRVVSTALVARRMIWTAGHMIRWNTVRTSTPCLNRPAKRFDLAQACDGPRVPVLLWIDDLGRTTYQKQPTQIAKNQPLIKGAQAARGGRAAAATCQERECEALTKSTSEFDFQKHLFIFNLMPFG